MPRRSDPYSQMQSDNSVGAKAHDKARRRLDTRTYAKRRYGPESGRNVMGLKGEVASVTLHKD